MAERLMVVISVVPHGFSMLQWRIVFYILPIMANKKKSHPATIAENRKARHDYALSDEFEAGMVLEGWEVKSIRNRSVQIGDAHVIVKHGEAWLLNAHITPLPTASTHIDPDPARTRKLLLHAKEIDKLVGHTRQKGYTVVPLRLYWKKARVKLLIALAKGKKLHDKRQSAKDRDWNRQKQRIMKQS